MNRRRCVSLDELAIHKSGYLEHSQATSADFTTSSEQSPERHLNATTTPARPPFDPPERIKTPEGVPTWRGQLPPQPANASGNENTETSFLSGQLRMRGSRVFRRVFGQPMQQTPAQQRIWRPPVSGHTTHRFGELEHHPFANVPVIHGHTSEDPRNINDNGSHSTRSDARLLSSDGPERAARQPPAREVKSTKRNRVLSVSQRALQAANGNVVPVSSRRARARAGASNAARSVPLPTDHVRSTRSATRVDDVAQEIHPNRSIRTIDMIQQFPSPPTTRVLRPRPMSAGHRSLLLSLFPSVRTQCQHASSGATSSKVREGSRSNTLQAQYPRPLHFATLDTLPRNLPIQANIAENVSQRARTRDESDSTPLEQLDHLLIRGENTARYRHSGTPVYDHDTASLRSLDRHTDNELVQALQGHQTFPRRLSYPRTNGTVMTTRPQSQVRDRSCAQEQRAVTNGALKFASRPLHNADNSNASPTPAVASNNDNDFPITPVTITRAAREFCRHGIPRPNTDQVARSYRTDLDGTSPCPDSGEAVSTFTEPPAPSHPNMTPGPGDHRPSTAESWAHLQHIRHRLKRGTWRTRMTKTRCWRCELESRRTAAHEARYNRTKGLCHGWSGRWERLVEKIKWTCFCRYRAYEEDSEDEGREGEVEERARLGRMGAELT